RSRPRWRRNRHRRRSTLAGPCGTGCSYGRTLTFLARARAQLSRRRLCEIRRKRWIGCVRRGDHDRDVSVIARAPARERMWFDGALVNADEIAVRPFTHALHYGSAVFEGIRAYEARRGTAVFRLRD